MNELIAVKKLAEWDKLKALVLDRVSSPITRRVEEGRQIGIAPEEPEGVTVDEVGGGSSQADHAGIEVHGPRRTIHTDNKR